MTSANIFSWTRSFSLENKPLKCQIGKLLIHFLETNKVLSMESDPEKADQKKSLWNEVKVTGVNFIFLNFEVFSCLKN